MRRKNTAQNRTLQKSRDDSGTTFSDTMLEVTSLHTGSAARSSALTSAIHEKCDVDVAFEKFAKDPNTDRTPVETVDDVTTQALKAKMNMTSPSQTRLQPTNTGSNPNSPEMNGR